MFFPDVKPGRVVEHDGELFLIEDVIIEITMQRIESHTFDIETMLEGEQIAPTSPVFLRLRGRLGDGQFAEDRFKPLYKAEEL